MNLIGFDLARLTTEISPYQTGVFNFQFKYLFELFSQLLTGFPPAGSTRDPGSRLPIDAPVAEEFDSAASAAAMITRVK
jgi:hypothetical protein